PIVLGRDWSTIDELAGFYRRVKGNRFARAGLEMAAWDALSRAQGRPLRALLGGTRSEIVSGVRLGIADRVEPLLDLLAQYHDARKALDLGACRVINIKVSRLGGLCEAKRVHDLCLARGVPVWCGGMHEFGIGRAANVALASLPGFTIPGDVSGSDKYYAEDVV